jgi:hypothetical protein
VAERSGSDASSLEQDIIEGDNPVHHLTWLLTKGPLFKESSCLGLQLKMGGKFHLKLNMGERPIANKYREGKMKSTLKREWKVREIVERETLEASQGFLEIRRSDLSSQALRLAFWADSVFDSDGAVFCTSLVNKSTSVWRFAKKVTGFGWALAGFGASRLKACLSW